MDDLDAEVTRRYRRIGGRVFTNSNRSAQMKVFTLVAASALALAALDCWGQGAGPTDPQIAAIVVTANQVDIDAGKLAKSKAENKEVKAFATSRSLKSGGEANIEHLKTLTGAAFDRAYIDNEVTYHQSVLDAIDHTLIPSAKNAELKALLVKVRPAFEAHLVHAKQIQSTLRS
jgi:putative membrane protein